METSTAKSTAINHYAPANQGASPVSSSPTHSAPEVVEIADAKAEQNTTAYGSTEQSTTGADFSGPERDGVGGGSRFGAGRGNYFAYLRTRNFWIVLLLGQVLALCITSTNTFSTLLVAHSFSIPAFQTFWNYVMLNLLYTGYSIYKYGFRGYVHTVIVQGGWKYLILSFLDVEGNYFTVLAYRYTTILSAQLINFWAIVVVVLISSIFLRVRYHWTQILGILICIGGVGILFGSDHITQGSTTGGISGSDQLKGDLFALAGATFYGLSNVAEEFLVSKRPLYEVVGQLGFWGMLISGAQTGIFDRDGFHAVTDWRSDGQVAGYMVGYTLCLTIFYSGAPLMFRLASAAFFNISLLTGNFWGVVIGVKVFGLSIHWMYPIAFVCIIGGLVVYFVGKSSKGDAEKPWLGRAQEGGVDGVGTARRQVERPDALV